MPFVEIETPMAPGRPRRIHYRAWGTGPPLVMLHSGWGWEAYPFDAQVEALAGRYRMIAPDRSGYGSSASIPDVPDGYHRLYAIETLRVLDALGVPRAALWGHSDGAVVAAWAAVEAPGRVRGAVLEAFHFRRAKVGSVGFFETAAADPERFGEAVVAALRRDHGEPRWREIVGAGARAWLRIIDAGRREGGDVYDGRLAALAVPALLLHGDRDPRTEPGEIEEALASMPGARLARIDTGHAPHASPRVSAEATRVAARFLDALPP
jgi:3-oxoadipate enol-lactonase